MTASSTFLLAGLLMAASAIVHAADGDASTPQQAESQQQLQPQQQVPQQAQAAVAPVAAKDAEVDDPNRKVCKYTVQTGSRMGRKICHTQAYWEEMELAARNKMREIDSQAIQQKSN